MKKMTITYRELEQGIKLLQSSDKEIQQLGIELLKLYDILVFHTVCSNSLFLIILDSGSRIYIYRNMVSGQIKDEKINDLQIFYAKWLTNHLTSLERSLMLL